MPTLIQSFDSTQYAFQDIVLKVAGVDLTGIQSVSYKSAQAKEVIYGKGVNGVAIQRGKITNDGSIVLLQSEYEALVAASPTKNLLDLHFDITVTYGNPQRGDKLITDVLSGCEFTEMPKELGNDNNYMKLTLPFIFLRIQNQK